MKRRYERPEIRTRGDLRALIQGSFIGNTDDGGFLFTSKAATS